jgi:tRNA pseudouridine55 synthase
MAIILWNKKYTETLATTLKRLRLEKPEYKDEKLTYAGRLDPMAEGLLILLSGDDVYRKDEFLGLDKVYEVDFIFGIETDTYDVLGFIKSVSNMKFIGDKFIENELNSSVGIHEQKYPIYSSKTVFGKTLFQWARESRIGEIKIPSKNVEIFSADYIGNTKIEAYLFKETLFKNIKKVDGDFRQKDIISKWNDYFEKNNDVIYIYKIRIHASSGTYMRSFVHELGKKLNTHACSVKIKRLQIGKYKL